MMDKLWTKAKQNSLFHRQCHIDFVGMSNLSRQLYNDSTFKTCIVDDKVIQA